MHTSISNFLSLLLAPFALAGSDREQGAAAGREPAILVFESPEITRAAGAGGGAAAGSAEARSRKHSGA
jgi:hypothetical protein